MGLLGVTSEGPYLAGLERISAVLFHKDLSVALAQLAGVDQGPFIKSSWVICSVLPPLFPYVLWHGFYSLAKQTISLR